MTPRLWSERDGRSLLNMSMENDLRRWMRLVESDDRKIVRVFHGSPESTLNFRTGLFYGVRDFGFAASYATERGRGTGFVHTLDFHFHKLADDNICHQIADELGSEQIRAVNIPDDNHYMYDERIFMRLTELGYDGITGYDFGFRSDFEELIVWLVFDAAAQITSVAVTPVSGEDMKHKHEPS